MSNLFRLKKLDMLRRKVDMILTKANIRLGHIFDHVMF